MTKDNQQTVDKNSIIHADTGLKEINSQRGDLLIGRVASPPPLESTSEQFYFWVQRGRLVEKSQIVCTESSIDGKKIQFYGVVGEVRRRSRKSDIHEEFDIADGEVEYEPEFKAEGVTYASANILRTEPAILTPPIEQSRVYLGGETEAGKAYGYDEMKYPMAVGRLCNGGSNFAGLAKIDLAYLLGDNGGHLNVTGMAGAGAKSSFLLTVIKMLLSEAESRHRLHVVPIIFNVKGEDLMWIDRPNREFQEKHKKNWAASAIEPAPFKKAQFYSPMDPRSNGAPTIDGCNANAYAWSLSDVLQEQLFPFLFAGDNTFTPVMMALVYDIVAFLTDAEEKQLKPESPQTWNELLDWIRKQAGEKEDTHHFKLHQIGTWRAIYRRLRDILEEGESIFPRAARSGRPLLVTRSETSPPQVIDIHDLSASLQRFVVAAIVKQVVAARTGRLAVPSLRYLLILDELNRFAPRNSSDAITQLIERIASEMRSQGIILLGAQQLASQVSTKIIENASIRVLGRTGPGELQDRVWQAWDASVRRQASMLKVDEKLVMQPTFSYPLFVKIPFPAWAMRREDIAPPPLDQTPEV